MVQKRGALLAGLLIGVSACGEIGLSMYSPAAVHASGEAMNGSSTGDGGAGTGPGPGQQGNGQAGGDGSAEPGPACTHDQFPILMHQATQDNSVPGQPLFMYQARNTDTERFDELQILSYQASPYNGPTSPGTYALEDLNYSDCGLCLLIVTDCTNSYQCDRVFFVDQGVLKIQDFGSQGGPFQAVLRDAVFLEVSIDPNTFATTPVPGGASWCIDEIAIDTMTLVYN